MRDVKICWTMKTETRRRETKGSRSEISEKTTDEGESGRATIPFQGKETEADRQRKRP